MAERLVFIQEAFLESIINDHENLLSLSERDKTGNKLRSFLNTLESDFSDSKRYHTSLLKMEAEEDLSVVKEYVKKGVMNRIRSQYHSYWADLSTFLEPKVNPILTSTMNASQEEKKPYNIKLPTIEIPSFSGKYEEWTAFYNLFEATIDKNQNLEEVQKLHYLLKAVTGEAHNHIKNLTLTNENYEIAKEILKDQYDHKRKIGHVYVKKLLEYPSIKNETAKDFRNLLSTIKDCSASLEQLKLPVQEWDFLLLCIMQPKIPSSTYRE